MGALSIISTHWEYYGVTMCYQIFKVVGEFGVYACWCHPNCGHKRANVVFLVWDMFVGEGPVFRSFSFVKQSWELGFFSLFKNSDWLASTFHRSEDPKTTRLVPSVYSKDPSTTWLVPSTAEDPTCWKQVSSGR